MKMQMFIAKRATITSVDGLLMWGNEGNDLVQEAEVLLKSATSLAERLVANREIGPEIHGVLDDLKSNVRSFKQSASRYMKAANELNKLAEN